MAEEEKINCRISRQKERRIKELTQSLNEARNPKVKANKAQLLINEVKPLLDCAEYNEESADCEICRNVANLRKKTAELVIKASKLAH